ncbi:uncharacterized protein LOC119174838 [Rhipicephalus microplus]|uniref:uncharacterized protein LOC119174838 n=1 Tax=Rhipicephalus microplus TaxID=6941 RepID=UPI0018891047|nr:uncharacterized protein LOC119174838 [Rhipicephalus microplus]
MAAFSNAAFYGSVRERNRPRVCDETAERILERIAARESSDLDLSDSDEEAPEDVAVLDDLEKHLEPDVDSSDEEPVHTAPAAPKRAALWKTTDSSPQAWLPDFNVTSDSGEVRALWRPFEYFQEYISDEMWETMSTAMNTAHVVETGKSLCTTPEELKVFFCSFDHNVVSWVASNSYVLGKTNEGAFSCKPHDKRAFFHTEVATQSCECP